MISVRQVVARAALAALALDIALAPAIPRAASPKFHRDDPLQHEPATQDASKAQGWEIDLFWDLALNLFGNPGDPTPGVKAQNVNTIDEVPDSSWFTNRIGARPLSIEDAVRGPLAGEGPAPGTWTVSSAKEAGFAPGFTIQDAGGQTWFVSFDADGYPDDDEECQGIRVRRKGV